MSPFRHLPAREVGEERRGVGRMKRRGEVEEINKRKRTSKQIKKKPLVNAFRGRYREVRRSKAKERVTVT